MLAKLGKLFKSYTFNFVLVIGLTALVLYLTLHGKEATVLAMLKNIKVGWVIVMAVAMIGTRVLLGYGLMLECHLSDPQYKLSQGVVNAFVASFFNGITPSSTGGQFAQVYLFRKQGIPISRSAGVLWMDFIIYQSTMILSVFILILLKFPVFYAKYSQFFIIVIFGFLVNSAVIVGLWAMVRFPKFYTWLTTKGIQIGVKMKLIKDKEAALKNINAQLERFGEEVKILRTHKELLIQVGLCDLGRLMLYYAIPFFCALALQIPVSPALFIDILALSSFVSMVNAFIPLPGASGGTEATFVLMFSTIFGSINATSIMLLWRFMTYYFMLICGGIIFIIAKRTLDDPTGFTPTPSESTEKKEEH